MGWEGEVQGSVLVSPLWTLSAKARPCFVALPGLCNPIPWALPTELLQLGGWGGGFPPSLPLFASPKGALLLQGASDPGEVSYLA